MSAGARLVLDFAFNPQSVSPPSCTGVPVIKVTAKWTPSCDLSGIAAHACGPDICFGACRSYAHQEGSMDSSFNLKDAVSIAIGWLMVPALFSLLFGEHGGVSATLFVGLLAALIMLRKVSSAK